MTTEFKIGDYIKKTFKPINLLTDNQIFKIIDLKKVKGGNWHDGFSISFIATIEPVIDHAVNPETETEEYCVQYMCKINKEYCVQYINYMCQINNIYAVPIDIIID